MTKPRVIKDYDKLSVEVQHQIKFIYPKGFSHHLVNFTNRDGEQKLGLPFETDEYYYLIRMSQSRAVHIIDEDEDYDDEGHLKSSAREELGERFKDLELAGNNANADNEFSTDDEEHDPYADRDKVEVGEEEEDEDNY
ncbi:MAG: hypothetical protein AAGA85_15735 [Bacteroidota bacterium]